MSHFLRGFRDVAHIIWSNKTGYIFYFLQVHLETILNFLALNSHPSPAVPNHVLLTGHHVKASLLGSDRPSNDVITALPLGETYHSDEILIIDRKTSQRNQRRSICKVHSIVSRLFAICIVLIWFVNSRFCPYTLSLHHWQRRNLPSEKIIWIYEESTVNAQHKIQLYAYLSVYTVYTSISRQNQKSVPEIHSVDIIKSERCRVNRIGNVRIVCKPDSLDFQNTIKVIIEFTCVINVNYINNVMGTWTRLYILRLTMVS